MENISGLIPKLNDYFIKNINISYVTKERILIVTKDDEFYEFDRNPLVNKNSWIVLSEDRIAVETAINEALIQELSDKQVIDLKNGLKHMVARTVQGKLYCWGYNERGVLGNGLIDSNYYEPELNEYLSDKMIIDISCGAYHTLALTIDGKVYGWGCNKYGQIGNDSKSKYQLIPDIIKGFNGEKVKSISCGYKHSIALTERNNVYVWGSNESGQIGVNLPKTGSNTPVLILSEKIEKISGALKHTLLLTSEGSVVMCGDDYKDTETNQNKKLTQNNFIDMVSNFKYDIFAAKTENMFYVWGKCDKEFISEPTQKDFSSFTDFFKQYCNITFKAVPNLIIDFNDEFLRNNYFNKSFIDLPKLGAGGYGEVYRVRKESDNLLYAVKKMQMRKYDSFLRELESSTFVTKFQYNKIVQYFDIWLENELKSDNKQSKLIFYIQMELCDKNLSELINEMKNDRNLTTNSNLTPLGYYISCEVFIEILEGVNYLHKRKPQIIHRDLNPYNIMLKLGPEQSFVKICDFGLAAIHKLQTEHEDSVGHMEYAAPEVRVSGHYDTKADIYSLGVILEKLFLINVNRDYNETENLSSLMISKYLKLQELCERMINNSPNDRPDSKQILEEKNLWAIRAHELDLQTDFQTITNSALQSFVNELLKYLLRDKPVLRNGDLEKHFNYTKEDWKEGSYGKVFIKAKNLSDGKNYAIKSIDSTKFVNRKTFWKELETSPIFLRLKDDRVVQYFDVWLENDFIINNGIKVFNENLILYIQMESCDKTLSEVMIEIKNNRILTIGDSLTPLGYYIASEIFIEILEGVNYLHKQNYQRLHRDLPPDTSEDTSREPSQKSSHGLIHRDLYPANIMLTIGSNNRFVKIVDFGLVAIHEYADQSHTSDTGNIYYQSPELRNGRQYNTKTDIYSLGVILQEFFYIDPNRINSCESRLLQSKYRKAKALSIEMKNEIYDERPSCEEILKVRDNWALHKSELDVGIIEMWKHSSSGSESFVDSMLKLKFEQ